MSNDSKEFSEYRLLILRQLETQAQDLASIENRLRELTDRLTALESSIRVKSALLGSAFGLAGAAALNLVLQWISF